ncbi:hypothetical protein SAMN05421538_101151 [Paracoccus isoporae]|uniref:Methyltransferase domain-containing protein n=1 Tax=Paracoccus isoporae TaxID=591205 RepID=A0A1G6T037_9RHOB|nr:hypothetical protein [Paracoccus isoporae]SDD22550.1 hypothetical protein SAMN05421538_101151 [Paracoccus isoporae]
MDTTVKDMLESEEGTEAADGPAWKKASGMHYIKFLRSVHEKLLFDLYFEIGTCNGHSLYPSRSRTVAVDPYFRVKDNAIGVKPELHVFQCGSDEFFERDFLKRNDMKISFGFLDGMHLFEYLLRDFINAERNCREGAVLALHDCCPYNFTIQTRDLNHLPRDAWTGDVWKLLPVLRKYRPDLTLTVLACAPTGLVLVTGLDPENDKLSRHYDEILSDWVDVEMRDYGVDRFNESFEFHLPRKVIGDGFSLFAGAAMENAVPLAPVKVST